MTRKFDVHTFAAEHKFDNISIFDFDSFAPLYSQVYYHFRGQEPFNIQLRRAFNRHKRIGLQDQHFTYRGSTIILATADELDPETEWLEVAV